MENQNKFTKWICFVVHPHSLIGHYAAMIVAFGAIAALALWHNDRLDRLQDWFANQNGISQAAIGFAAVFVAYSIALFCIGSVFAKIHYAIDPAYETQRAQKRKEKSGGLK
jgi:hypothetical protein